jgi:hypothetical protein
VWSGRPRGTVAEGVRASEATRREAKGTGSSAASPVPLLEQAARPAASPRTSYPLIWRVKRIRPEWCGRRCRIVIHGRAGNRLILPTPSRGAADATPVLTQISRRRGRIERVQRGYTPIVELELQTGQYVANVELEELGRYDRPDRLAMDRLHRPAAAMTRPPRVVFCGSRSWVARDPIAHASRAFPLARS